MYPNFTSEFSYSFDISNWNWSLTDLAVPHLGAVEGLGTRLENLVTGLDELGYQYYLGTGNHTNNYTTYHFNYCISLITGIFDALALFTRDKYDMDIDDERTTIRTGGKPLFKQLQDHNEDLWHYIHQNHPFVELMYVIRPQIIHKDGVLMRGPGYSHSGGSNRSFWNSHIIKYEDMEEKYQTRFEKFYNQLQDEKLEYDPITKWGLICPDEKTKNLPMYNQFIEPYQFIKTSSRKLTEYVDGYLEILGNENRLQMLSEDRPERYDELMRFKNHMISPLL